MHIIKKIKLHSFTIALVVLGGLLPILYTPSVSAAAAGTCYFEADQGVPAYVGQCSSAVPQPKDSKGQAIDPSKCYDVTGSLATLLSCTSSKLDEFASQRASCAAHGGTFNEKTHVCTDETIAIPSNGDGAIGGNCTDISKCDLMNKYIYPLINFLAALVGVAVTISLVIGGIQYGSSAGDPQKVTAAKNRIRNAIIALVTFIFLYALLNFLVPGGLLK